MRGYVKKALRRIFPDRGPAVLGYHRVIDLDIDTWGMAVSPLDFENQIKLVSRYAREELSRLAVDGSSRRIHIVFDDGYVDNLEYALPILKRYHVPATVFLATGFVGTGREYWWDHLERILLLPGKLPENLDLPFADGRLAVPLGRDWDYSEADFERYRHWRAWMAPPTMRHQVYSLLWYVLYRAEPAARDRLIAALDEWASFDGSPRPGYAPVTADQVREMQKEGISFGAHTVNHLSFSQYDEGLLSEEIRESITTVREITGTECRIFSYPHGDTGGATGKRLLEKHGIERAFTSKAGRIRRDQDPLLIPRYFVGNDGERLVRKLVG